MGYQTILVVYFNRISGRFNLDYAFLHPFFSTLYNEAKVKGKWFDKAEKCYRTVLGSNVGVFDTENEALEFAKQLGFPAQPYDMIIRTKETTWLPR